jgi:hypothetical protein
VKAGHGALGTRLTQQIATNKNLQVIYQKIQVSGHFTFLKMLELGRIPQENKRILELIL